MPEGRRWPVPDDRSAVFAAGAVCWIMARRRRPGDRRPPRRTRMAEPRRGSLRGRFAHPQCRSERPPRLLAMPKPSRAPRRGRIWRSCRRSGDVVPIAGGRVSRESFGLTMGARRNDDARLGRTFWGVGSRSTASRGLLPGVALNRPWGISDGAVVHLTARLDPKPWIGSGTTTAPQVGNVRKG